MFLCEPLRLCASASSSCLFTSQRRLGSLEQQAILHARRAGRLAGAAAQAEVDVGLKRTLQPDATVGRAAHQRDAPARAVHLQLIHRVGRAGGEAEATVDALVQLAAEVGRVEQVDVGHGSNYRVSAPNLQGWSAVQV